MGKTSWIFVMKRDGRTCVGHLTQAASLPYGITMARIIFRPTPHPRGRDFELWAIDIAGTNPSASRTPEFAASHVLAGRKKMVFAAQSAATRGNERFGPPTES